MFFPSATEWLRRKCHLLSMSLCLLGIFFQLNRFKNDSLAQIEVPNFCLLIASLPCFYEMIELFRKFNKIAWVSAPLLWIISEMGVVLSACFLTRGFEITEERENFKFSKDSRVLASLQKWSSLVLEQIFGHSKSYNVFNLMIFYQFLALPKLSSTFNSTISVLLLLLVQKSNFQLPLEAAVLMAVITFCQILKRLPYLKKWEEEEQIHRLQFQKQRKRASPAKPSLDDVIYYSKRKPMIIEDVNLGEGGIQVRKKPVENFISYKREFLNFSKVMPSMKPLENLTEAFVLLVNEEFPRFQMPYCRSFLKGPLVKPCPGNNVGRKKGCFWRTVFEMKK